MKIASVRNFFEPRARLLIQLGDKLIKNESIALLELVKNGYDADARSVELGLYDVDSAENGVIDILDDGFGMDLGIIHDAWLEPGSDNKSQQFIKGERTEKYGRLPIGEKGIGRFGVHKLGSKIELISRMKGKNEVVVEIDWDEFSMNKYLKDAKFDVYEREPEYFKGSRTGTRIRVTKLRRAWGRKQVRDVYKSLLTLNSPFEEEPGSFKIEFKTNKKEMLEGLPNWEDVQKMALFHFKGTMEGSEIVDFKYEYTPWDELVKVRKRSLDINSDFVQIRRGLVRKREKKEEYINLSRHYGNDLFQDGIGSVEIQGYIFDRDSKILNLSSANSNKLLKDYLDEQGGVRVYRDKLRINEYGEKGNDWLGLDGRRVNTPAKRLSNNIVLATVKIDSKESAALIEKTNREGFIENDAYEDFKDAILYFLGLVETQREIDKTELKNKYIPTEAKEPVLAKIAQLKGFVEKKIDDRKTVDEISKQLDSIEIDYQKIQEILLTSAGAGITLGVGMHEVHKVLSELIAVVVSEVDVPDRVINLVNHLDNLIKNYTDILKQSDSEFLNLVEVTDGGIFNNSYRLDCHNIELVKSYCKNDFYKIKAAKRLLLGTISNLIDNSIYWLEKKHKTLNKNDIAFTKKIYIDILDSGNGTIELVFADNGPGFDIPTSNITKPFVSSKPSGMGLGLHIISQIMESVKGKLIFPEFGDYELPEEFKRGAIVILEFNKN